MLHKCCYCGETWEADIYPTVCPNCQEGCVFYNPINILDVIDASIDSITDNCFRIEWGCQIGFGTFDIFKDDSGEFVIDNETMPREFIKKVFSSLIDNLKLLDE